MSLFRSLGAALGATALVAAGMANASAATAPSDDESVGIRIVGGSQTNERWPFMAYYAGCGASLVAPTWLITAAHCTGNRPTVRIDSNDKHRGGEVRRVVRAIDHPNWGGSAKGYDIALLEIDRPAQATPIPIAASSGPAGTRTKLLGWGATNEAGSSYPRYLRELDVAIEPDRACTDRFNGRLEICTTGGNGRGACFGDSGGPQIKQVNGRWELIGATSRGPERCATDHSIYTDVQMHWDWINRASGGQIPAPGSGGVVPTTPGDTPTTPGGGGGGGGNEFSDTTPQPLRDRSTVTSTLNSTRSRAEKVTIGISAEHPCAQQLGLVVTTPDGTRNTLKRGSYSWNCTRWSGEKSQTYPMRSATSGPWLLEVSDTQSGQEGTFNGWRIAFS